MLIVEKQGVGWDPSMMRIINKLTKRTTKTGKFEKSLKIHLIVNFKTIRFLTFLTASGNIVQSILN